MGTDELRKCPKCGSILLYASDYCLTCEIKKEYDREQSIRGFKIGETFYGYCNGYFGRDCYENKVVEDFGKDWVVCRDEHDFPWFADFNDTKEFWELVEEWRNESNE